MKDHLTETHKHNVKTHNIVLLSQSIALISCVSISGVGVVDSEGAQMI